MRPMASREFVLRQAATRSGRRLSPSPKPPAPAARPRGCQPPFADEHDQHHGGKRQSQPLCRLMPLNAHGRCPPGGTQPNAPRSTWQATEGIHAMAERKRSRDGKSETSQYREGEAGEGGAGGTGAGGTGAGESGRSGGNLARDIGTEEALKRGREDRSGVTRVEKSDEHQQAEQKDSKR